MAGRLFFFAAALVATTACTHAHAHAGCATLVLALAVTRLNLNLRRETLLTPRDR